MKISRKSKTIKGSRRFLIYITQDEVLNQVKENLLKQIEENKILREKQANIDKIIIPEYKNPNLYKCQHGASLKPCAMCNKRFPVKMMTKRAHSQNHIAKRRN